MEHIYNGYKLIHFEKSNINDLLKGKVIERVYLEFGGRCTNPILLITFTDKTFIHVATEVKYDEDDGENYALIRNGHIESRENLEKSNNNVYYSKEDGKYKLYEPFNKFNELGLYGFSDEDLKEMAMRNEKSLEDSQYEWFLKLRDKFEKRYEEENAKMDDRKSD